MGKVIKYGDNIDTDAIIAARHLNVSDGKELAKHCMEDIDKTFAQRVREGDFIVAGENFGCGSSREHAPLCIKASGIKAVIAASFARIFYRNAINIGLPIIESAQAAAEISEGDEVSVDFVSGIITNATSGKQYSVSPFPKEISAIIEAGGLLAYSAKKGNG